MNNARYSILMALVVASAVSHAFSFSLTPVTTATSNQATPIFINGVVTVGAGETYIGWSQFDAPFLANFSAGFNGPPQNFTAAFLAWNGTGTYSGAIYEHNVNPSNLGYSGGMPVGLYGSNPFGPGGLSSIQLTYVGVNGTTQTAVQTYAIEVVPEPATLALIALIPFVRRKFQTK